MIFTTKDSRSLTRWMVSVSMTLYGRISVLLLSSTLFRFLFALFLLPPYVFKLVMQVLPGVLWRATSLLSPRGRDQLAADTDCYRQYAEHLANEQLNGSYRFQEFHLHRSENSCLDCLELPLQQGEFTVCGATARFVYAGSSHNADSSRGAEGRRRPIVLLHGNPSWSYMWRNVIAFLVDQGHEVYALDWLGHGRSDKIAVPELCNFELHMRTLIEFFAVTKLQDTVVGAHDWGGCIALCTLPSLPRGTCTGLFLLDSFLPPCLSEISLHCGLLYAIWFLTGGILGRYIPEWAVMFFMSPRLPLTAAEGYSAPYEGRPVSAKSSVYRFGHIVPGTPQIILRGLRNTKTWKVSEGLCGPSCFDNLDAQARLSRRGDEIRAFWARAKSGNHVKIVVVFGDRDPLLADFKDNLIRRIDNRLMVEWATDGIWLRGGGHYPVEEQADRIASLISRLCDSPC